MLDIAVSLLLLPLLGVVVCLAFIANRFEGGGTIWFRQTRYGVHGLPFSIHKLRTMRVAEDGIHFRQAHAGDARVTPFGRFLRSTSLDELPQILNVLKGDMSIVGPRPHPTLLDETYRDAIEDFEKRYHVKPGITGLAQVRGLRGPTETVEVMRKRIESDLEYVDRASLMLDIEILFRTLRAVLVRKNAF